VSIDPVYLRANQRHRLADGGRIDRDEPLTFSFAGRRLMGYRGDTLASALLANGVRIVGRSFKYARPRGILCAGVEEPNAILQVGGREETQTPNVRATEQPLVDGMVTRPVNGWPNADTDLMSVFGSLGGALMTPGFYYKTFMFPASRWETYEWFIRRAAGLGTSSKLADPDRYDHMNHHVDVLVVGAGPTGLAAALAASAGNKRVLLLDERSEAGGSLLWSGEAIDGVQPLQWVADAVARLDANPRVTRLAHTTVTGYHDHNFLTAWERRDDAHALTGGDTLPGTRQRLHKIRAGSVVLATGAHERPLVFANNDLPGCMTATAVSEYIRRYAVVPGDKLVVMTANDGGYRAAFDWMQAGREVVAVIDPREDPDSSIVQQAREAGITVITGSALVEARGRKGVTGALVAPINRLATFVTGDTRLLACDTIATSGGWSPAVHLSCHTGSRPVWDEEAIGFVPGPTTERRFAGGSVLGHHTLGECLAEGTDIGLQASVDASMGAVPEHAVPQVPVPQVMSSNTTEAPPMALFSVPHPKPASRAPKQFVDFQNDVTAAGIEQSTREGFESIEHVKRYNALGFGTDQGKTGNVNGMAIVARALGKSLPQVGTTVFRPNYTPVTMGAVAGAHVGELFDPERYTPMHSWHVKAGAEFENVGQWKRPWYYPQGNESMAEAIAREQLATRNGVGVLDASTLGKIDIRGPDAREFLGRVYTNAWAKLAPGRCRYGLMCGEDGMVMDDGVSACIADDHFHMTTTTGGAAHVLSWLELWQQTEWPELDVFFTSVTDQWATISLAGPGSRALLAELTDDIDLSAEAFGFMDFRTGHVAGIAARVFRISFTGDLSYEINVPAQHGLAVWEALFERGERHGLTPYGTETMHVLRAEKGFIIVGQDTDGSVTPHDLDHGWAVAATKPFSFIGKRGMQRSDCTREERKQLVGLACTDPNTVIPEGAQAVRDPGQAIPMSMVGHVTSSYYSAFLERSIAMGVIKGGLKRKGESVYFPLADGRTLEATICDPVFLDPEGARGKV
jgi:sarcosine oxidase subunit alpha